MVASIGAVASSAQGASYYERDGYYAKDDPEHLRLSAWAGRGAAELGLEGAVDPDVFRAVLEGHVPDGSGRRLGRLGKDGEIAHRPGRDLTLSAPKSVSLAALVGGDARVTEAHDRAVARTLAWFEKNVAETRMKDPETGRMARTGDQKTVIATFRHDTSRNLDPALHTHAVIANMVQGEDGKWRSMANERLYESKMLLGALYRSELAQGLARLGYGIEKTHADGRFEIAGVSREVVEVFSSRRAEIEAAVAERGAAGTADDQRLAQRAALMTRAAKRDIDRDELRESWEKQAAGLGFDARALAAEAARSAGRDAYRERRENVAEAGHGPAASGSGIHAALDAGTGGAGIGNREAGTPELVSKAAAALDWAVAHLSEREAVFARTNLLAAALAFDPAGVRIADVERAVAAREAAGTLHAARLPGAEGLLTTDRAVADEKETIALMQAGHGRGAAPMRARAVDKALRGGPLTHGQKEAVKLILASGDRTVGVQGYAGTGKTTMLNRARALLEKRGYEVRGLAPSASAARTLASEAGIGSETLQRFLARNAGVAEGRLTKKGGKEMRAAYAKTALVVDEGSLASTVQARDLLRIADALRIPRVVLVGDEKQLDAVDAGKPFAQLQKAGMRTVVMDEIMRQRDPELKAAVEASLGGDVTRAFEKLGENVAEVKADNLAGAAAARWLALSPEERANAGLMAPSHALREGINEIVRERLVRDGVVHGPAMAAERLVSRGYTSAEKTLAANYRAGDVVAFHRPYKRLGVEKGDELRVAGGPERGRRVGIAGTERTVRAGTGAGPGGEGRRSRSWAIDRRKTESRKLGHLTVPGQGPIFHGEAQARLALFPRPAFRRGLSRFWRPAGDAFRLSRRVRTYRPLHRSRRPQIQGEPGVRACGLRPAGRSGARFRELVLPAQARAARLRDRALGRAPRAVGEEGSESLHGDERDAVSRAPEVHEPPVQQDRAAWRLRVLCRGQEDRGSGRAQSEPALCPGVPGGDQAD